MISFRFYLVATISVFLALALGVVVGSTLIDRAIVESLRTQVDDVNARLDARVDEVDRLRRRVADLDDFTEQSAPFATEARLADRAVLVVVERGVDRSVVEDSVVQLRQSGALVPGALWLNPSWELSDADLRAELTEELALEGGSATETRAQVIDALIERYDAAALTTEEAAEAREASEEDAAVDPGGEGSGTDTVPSTEAPPSTDVVPSTEVPPTSGTVPAGDVPPTSGDSVPPDSTEPTTTTTEDPLAATLFPTLTAAGIVELETFGTEATDPFALEGRPLLVLVIGGPNTDPVVRGSAIEIADAASTSGFPTVVAEAWAALDGGPGRGDLLAAVRDDDSRSSRISTVDDLELLEGRVAAVLALADLERGVVGHYGYGSGADRVVPEWIPSGG